MEYIADLLVIFIILGVIGLVLTRRQSSGHAEKAKPVVNTGADAAAQTAASTAKRRADDPVQIVEDVKMTQTSRIVDAVQVLDELGEASPGYRHYCELVGLSQDGGGVTAPYSKRQVAYYDLRCYRIEVVGGRDVETLVAHEKSIEPFYFTDGSDDARMYVDLESFGSHCILVNATNRVEGPNSDFSRKFSSAMGAVDAQAGTGIPGVMACSDVAAGEKSAMRGRVGDGARSPRAWGVGAARAYVSGILAKAGHALGRVAAGARIAGGRMAGRTLVPATAGAGILGGAPGMEGRTRSSMGGNLLLAHGGPGGPGGPGGRRPPAGPYGTGRPRPQNGRNGMSPSFGGPQFTGMPRDLQEFLGGTGGVQFGGPRYRKNDALDDAVGTLVGMSVGALIGSLATQGSSGGDPTSVDQINTFRGYRIIEDVVPLHSPIYALGEIYRNGGDVFIGRSVSASYPSSYFATKPEAEVIAALS